MSGHSKWANIKRQKAVVDAKKGAAYARFSREIIVAARAGDDIAANFKLRQAVDRARAEGMPNDNIQRAIDKGSGSGQSANLEELVYEGYGPDGVAIMVRCATDNRNRTAGDIRYLFSKHGGNMGESGCVNWLFKERGEILAESKEQLDEEMLLSLALDAGADDIEQNNDDDNSSHLITFICSAQQIEAVKTKLSQCKSLHITTAQTNFVPQTVIAINEKETARQLLKLIDALENQDDTQQIYANFDIENDWLDEMAT